MVIIRKKEMKAMPEKDLLNRLKELRMELMKNNAQRATHQTVGKLKAIRRTIARLTALLRQKQKK